MGGVEGSPGVQDDTPRKMAESENTTCCVCRIAFAHDLRSPLALSKLTTTAATQPEPNEGIHHTMVIEDISSNQRMDTKKA